MTDQVLDMETMKTLAELTAKTAADSVAASLREEIRREFEHFERRITDKIDSEFRAHFGVLPPSEHVIQHSKLDSFLRWAEDMKKSAWRSAIGFVLQYGTTAALALYLFYMNYAKQPA